MAETQEVQIKITADTSNANKSVGSMKSQLKEATNELYQMREQFGETSAEAVQAAKRVAELRDEIGDAKALTEAFNPDAKFKAFGAAVQGVVGGFAALQGAQALFGSESKELQETLVKVQGALALSQGVDAILEAKDSFKVLKTVAIDALKGIKNAIGATGIGLLLVALGTIVAYWDDIKEAVSGVSEEQKKLNEQTAKNLEAQKEKLKAVDAQDNVLKLQGKSEKDILKLKIAQVDQTIAATQAVIEQGKITTKQQIAAAKRNQEFLIGALEFVEAPVRFIYENITRGINTLINVFNKISGKKIEPISLDFIDKANKLLAKQLFDPEKTAKEAAEVEKENLKAIDELKNQRAGFQLSIQGIDKAAADKRKAANDEEAKKLLEANKAIQKELETLSEENYLKSIAEDDKRAKEKIDLDRKRKVKEIEAGAGSEELKNKLIAEVNQKAELQKQAVDEEKRKKEEKFQIELSDTIAQNRINAEKDIRKKELLALEETSFQKRQKILNDETTNAEEKKLLIAQALIEEQRLKVELEEKFANEDAQKKIAKLEQTAKDETLAKELRLQAIADEQALFDQQLANKLISEEEYNKKLDELSQDRINIDIAEAEARDRIAGQIGDIAVGLVNLIKSTNEKSKGLAIASLIVEQAAAVAKIITSTQVANAKALGTPQAIATSGAAAIPVITANNIMAGISIASAVASVVKGINQIKSASPSGGGGGGGSAPNMGGGGGGGAVAPPIAPQVDSTLINQAQVNQMGSATARAYVVESDVSGSQERIQRINRAARIG